MLEEKKVSPEVSAYVSRLNIPDEKARPRLLAVLFCDFINQTGDGKTNLAGVFDRIYVNREQKKTPRFGLFIRTAETLPDPVNVSVFSPTSKLLLTLQYSADAEQFEKHSDKRPADYPKQVQAILGMQFAAEEEGVYWFDISYKGNSIGGVGLPIEHLAQEEGEKGATDTYI